MILGCTPNWELSGGFPIRFFHNAFCGTFGVVITLRTLSEVSARDLSPLCPRVHADPIRANVLLPVQLPPRGHLGRGREEGRPLYATEFVIAFLPGNTLKKRKISSNSLKSKELKRKQKQNKKQKAVQQTFVLEEDGGRQLQQTRLPDKGAVSLLTNTSPK